MAVADRQDCLPRFSQELYNFKVLSNATFPTSVGVVKTQRGDEGVGGECGPPENIQIGVENDDQFFYIASNGSVIAVRPLPQGRKTATALVSAK